MEKCDDCNCVEFNTSKKNNNICICGHSIISHHEIILPNGMELALKNTVNDLEMHRQRAKVSIDHMDILIDKLKKILEV